MRKQILTYAWLIIALLCWQMSAVAQVETETKQGLRRTTFTTDRGEVSVYLPNMLRKGDRISGTVMAEPSGKNDRQWEKNKTALHGYVVEIEEAPENEAAVDKDFFKWTIPATITGGIIHYVLKDENGKTVATEEMEVAEVLDVLPSGEELAVPPAIVPGSLVPARSHIFDGDLMNTWIKTGDRPAFILAESPREAFFVCPEDVIGPQTIMVVEGNEIQKAETNVVAIDMTADRTNLVRGESTEVTVFISGLEGIEVPIPVNVVNESPNTVLLSGGNEQVIYIAPAQVSEEGIYTETLKVFARHSGPFSIYADIALNLPVADVNSCPIIPDELLDPPPTPDGYVYVGREVVVGYTYVEELSTVPLDREPQEDDMLVVHSLTERIGGVECDYIVVHVFAKKKIEMDIN
jgi:hypothetical protein